MWYTIIIALVITFLAFSTSSCLRNGRTIFSVNDISPDDTIKGKFTKEFIREKLELLAKSEAPKDLKPGAMCYEAVALPDSASYLCPKCGEKTLYTLEMAWDVTRDLRKCREIADTMKWIELSLDESQYCKICSPNIEKPQLCMIYSFPDDKTKRDFCGINSVDLQLIDEFLKGKNVHLQDNMEEVPLKNYIKRLEELLEVDIDK
jgi:hypothetical protein